ncbi:MAG TPA: S8 family peptidase [Sphingomicrobium sp.]|nr:S8 family peptidase [Sphingomicrobium sp.]
MADEPTPDELREDLARTRLAGDLLAEIAKERAKLKKKTGALGKFPVIIEANAGFPLGARQARDFILHIFLNDTRTTPTKNAHAALERTMTSAFREMLAELHLFATDDKVDDGNSVWTDYYVFGCLGYETILRLSQATVTLPAPKDADAPRSSGNQAQDECAAPVPLVHKIWLNHSLNRNVFESVRTVKCDAARVAFEAAGEGIVWAVADTGIDGTHPHFLTNKTLELPNGLEHHDFSDPLPQPLVDTDGHGTHVAGIIAGETCKADALRIVIKQNVRVSDIQVNVETNDTRATITGMAPKCKLLSLKVLQSSSGGDVALLLAAIGYIHKANDYGANVRIHGLNLSLGYTFDARWFAAGRSPLCQEVDRLVRNGVIVVVAAGNGGYGTVQTLSREVERAAHLATINDPGNSNLAITVGSTHRDSPHGFGISYFSSKGPTSDGRMKPDLVAPGERIVSAAQMDPANPGEAPYREDSGTSMAAPHVSGCIAAFLSVRREFRGDPMRVKEIFTKSATDLGRRPEFQGAGLIDLMRALQSV